MDKQLAIKQIQGTCKDISISMMKIHPALPHLENEAVQKAIIDSAHRLTTELETIKKKIIELQKRDDSSSL